MFEIVRTFWYSAALVMMYSAATLCCNTMDDINTEKK